MKLLFDQNLSRHLVARLSDDFPDSAHVLSLGLDTSSDNDIWDYAGQHGYTIVSKDSDFRPAAPAGCSAESGRRRLVQHPDGRG